MLCNRFFFVKKRDVSEGHDNFLAIDRLPLKGNPHGTLDMFIFSALLRRYSGSTARQNPDSDELMARPVGLETRAQLILFLSDCCMIKRFDQVLYTRPPGKGGLDEELPCDLLRTGRMLSCCCPYHSLQAFESALRLGSCIVNG